MGCYRGTLVLVDEAGMADTLTLDQIVHHATGHGAQVRLIGDDQQLTAIGAGGILRDIKNTAGAVHLEELMRFSDPAEAQVTLALREGDTGAIRFYEDRDRIHIGDQLSILHALHPAWDTDRKAGLESLMLAPTRDQVADLNRRAQHTLYPHPDRAATRISDGNAAGVGDTVITRTNNRRLRLSATDWVKNGDRWHVTGLGDDGFLNVTNQQSRLSTRLPAGYVTESVELGYASTIHTAQGTTVDTVHGLITGTETRQDLYTMLTRGRHENHVYLAAGARAGDPHDLITPDAVHPSTATEILRGVIDRDGAAVSATTQLQTAHDPAVLFRQATDRYLDALTVACETTIGTGRITAIEQAAEHHAPGISDQPAWPTLRARLIHHEATGHNAADLLNEAAHRYPLTDTRVPAAALTWRIRNLINPEAETNNTELDLQTPIPARLLNDPEWGKYLTTRQQLAQNLGAWNRHTIMRAASSSDLEPAPAHRPTRDRHPTGPSALQRSPRTGPSR